MDASRTSRSVGSLTANLQGPIVFPERMSLSILQTSAEGLFEAARCSENSFKSRSTSHVANLDRSLKTLRSCAVAESSSRKRCAMSVTRS